MKYASEVIDLLSAYPGRQFRMADIVRYVMPQAVGAARQRVRNGVLRVLDALAEGEHIVIRPAICRGGGAVYAWLNVPHDVPQNRHEKCHNSLRTSASI